MAAELFQLSACEMVAKLKSGEISIVEALEDMQCRIETVESHINALPITCFEQAKYRALELQASPVQERGLLCGLPITVKDLNPVKDVRCTRGSIIYSEDIPSVSDQLVTRMEDEGGVVYAKSNTPEFGTGGITFNDVLGITRSPHNCQNASGGSSGGAAASLAAGTAWLSHGSDMAGSLRTPASFCGVTSLRPSPGTILADSEYLPFDVLGANGPMARNIADLALFCDAMRIRGIDQVQSSTTDTSLYTAVSDLQIAFSQNLGITSVDDDVTNVFLGFIGQLESAGSRLTESHPDLTGVHEVFDILRAQVYATRLEENLARHPGVMKPEVEWNINLGLSLTAEQIRHALRGQGQIVSRAASFMQDVDVLICPAASVSAVSAALRYPGSSTGVGVPDYYRWLAIAYATTMTSLPIITLPCGVADNGMPVAVQLIGKPRGESSLFRVAQLVEELVGRDPKPIDPKFTDR